MLYARIKKKLGDFQLDIEIESRQETLALFGPSGSGKSMALKCIAGIERPDEGEIVLNDRILFSSKKKISLIPQERRVGLLFQNYALFPNMTLKENIAIGLPRRHANKEGIVREKILAFSLEGLENNFPHQLSGGQQQRTALARMLVNEPEILMLDEPFSALDGHLRWQMERNLASLLEDYPGSALYVSHNKDEVYRLSDRIAVIHRGKIDTIGSKEEIFKKPNRLDTALLTGCDNISRARKINNHRVLALDWDMELETQGLVRDDLQYVGIHGNSINLSRNPLDHNSFKMRILNRIKNSSSQILVLNQEGKTDYTAKAIYVEVSNRDWKGKGLDGDEIIHVSLAREDLLLLYEK